ncbi:MAG: flagellar export protein FliJ [Gammaproteobacteria bacterium]|nr:flagellar export protein FliJ [Gammaproteobacteria bacterium]MBU1415448.1 flagellar export protein FliJ [Gammaproteobacteria bacterium]
MTKAFPLQSILDLSQIRLEEATRRLGELISGEQQAAQRLELLAQYRDEYHERFIAAARDGLTRNQWHNYQSFLDRLDVAIRQARELVAQSHQQTAAGQQEWLDKRGRVKAFDTLAQRHQSRVATVETRQEQRNLDEHASRSHSRGAQEDGEQ